MNDRSVNSQVTDSVTQTDTIVVGSAPALTAAELMLLTSQSLVLAAQNATNAQQNNNVNAHASITMGLKQIFTANNVKAVEGEVSSSGHMLKSPKKLKVKGSIPYPLMYPKYP